MKRVFILITLLAGGVFAQTAPIKQPEAQSNANSVQIVVTSPVIELANATLKAHGGDKFKQMTSLTVTGSVDITPASFPQKIPATFVTIFSGEKYRFELNNPMQPVKQVFDGTDTFSNAPGGFQLPPVNRLGLPLIQRIGDENFVVTALEGDKDFKKGFRITSPEGFFTDFTLDKKTGLIKGYTASFTVNGNSLTTSVEIDKMIVVDGVTIPEKYAQRFDLGQFTVYADFKAKEVLVNREIKDDVFTMK
ncbi:MAG: hypothetical protein KIS76_03635 [Pyrinomonadaceae bacterium]|nr:hypothetical protein [Pyrinomonadaceae bacterium]